MTNGQRTVAGMLAVVAVLLGLNLIVNGSPRAVAQEPEIRIFPKPPHLEPTAVAIYSDPGYLYRLWSDGTVELNIVNAIASGCFRHGWCGWQTVPEDLLP